MTPASSATAIHPAIRLALILLPALVVTRAVAAEPAPGSPEFFEQKIRPLFVNRCYECHGNGQTKGGLSLESADALKKGGSSGVVLEPGKPEESLLVEAVSHAGDVKMPPKEKLSDREIADVTAWVKAGAVWPETPVSIPLGNLFDDDAQVSLGDALGTDEFKAVAEADDLAVERVRNGWSGPVEISPGIRFDCTNAGGSIHAFGTITNDGWNTNGGMQTLGKNIPENADRLEQGIGMHANALVTFDLGELRTSGGLPADQAFVFRSDRAGLDDTVAGAGATSAHVIVLIHRATLQGPVVEGYVNGQPVAVQSDVGIYKFTGELPAPVTANGKFARFDVPIPADAKTLTLMTTGAGVPADNPINSDHTVFSGARLEFLTTNSNLAKLGKTEGPQQVYTITDEQRRFWAFQPIRDIAPPAVKHPEWMIKPWDAFIVSQLEERGLNAVAPADRRTLIRRVTFDLIGLPPTPEEIDAFEADAAPDAFARVVDRLLSSPHYGERWGRYWLDVARYGEDQAHTFQARAYPQGWRYRDWVVDSLNRDLPFDRFVIEQIAGDLVEPSEKETPYDRTVALGYFALGPVYYADAGCAFKATLDELDDRIDTLTRGFMGLTVACARCHDHKFDPIPQTDYYALAGIFQSSAYKEAPLAPQETVDKYNAGQQTVQKADQEVNAFLDEQARLYSEVSAPQIATYITAVWKHRHPAAGQSATSLEDLAKQLNLRESVLKKWERALDAGDKGKIPALDKIIDLMPKEGPAAGEAPAEFLAAAEAVQKSVVDALAQRDKLQAEYVAKRDAMPEAEREKLPKPETPKEQAELIKSLFTDKGPCAVAKDQVEKLLADAQKQQLTKLRGDLETAKKAAPPMYPVAHSLMDGKTGNMKLHVRGNPAKTGAEVPRHFLSILSPSAPVAFTQGSGRLELARAIASPDNPLTARVIVNRIWQQHFGRGLVATPSNFGKLGERPSHPELLDHLSAQFIAHGWSLKWLHRELLLSATYQRSSASDARNEQVDAENVSLWRMPRRRLDAEAWRDAMLAVSGTLDPKVGGPSLDLNSGDNRRRTFYAQVSRHNLNDFLRLFDFPDPNITSDRRSVTTVPLQQLFVLNSDFMVRQAKGLSARLEKTSADDGARVRAAFPLLYGRPVTEAELQLALDFLHAEPSSDPADKTAKPKLTPWEQFAQILLGANEFNFVD